MGGGHSAEVLSSPTSESLKSRGGGQGGPTTTQFLETIKPRAFSTNARSKFPSMVLEGVLGPSTANQVMSLYICSSGSNARGESRALEGLHGH